MVFPSKPESSVPEEYRQPSVQARPRFQRPLLYVSTFADCLIPGNNNPGTHGDSVDKTDQKEDQIARRTDRRQCITSKEIPYDQGIGRII